MDEFAVDFSNIVDPDPNAEFPSSWFPTWIAFHQDTQQAAEREKYTAVTDITAFFENVSLEILFDQLHMLLGEGNRELRNQLRELLEYWDWALSPNKTRRKGLPQGNDVSSFLANVYLRDLDQVMLKMVGGDAKKYYRYVDDIQVYTSDRNEACRAIITLERTLRQLGLNVQSAKTEVKPAKSVFDPEVLRWEKKLEDSSENKLDWAREYIQNVFSLDDSKFAGKGWDRIYRRSLTVLGENNDPLAIPVALKLFLCDPSHKSVLKNFAYLKRFVSTHFYEVEIYDRLAASSEHTFDYHRAFIFRLAAYSRGEHARLRVMALEHAVDSGNNWFSRVAALLNLSTHDLSGHELGKLSHILDTDSDAQVLRAVFVTLTQHSRDH